MSVSPRFILLQFVVIYQFTIAIQQEFKSDFQFDGFYNPVVGSDVFTKLNSNYTEGREQFESEEDICHSSQLLEWRNPIVPIISSIYYFDNASVAILRSFLKKNDHSLTATHLRLIRRYVNEWDSYLEDKSMNEDDWKLDSDSKFVRFGIPDTVGFMDLLFRLTFRVLRDLPRILQLSQDELWLKSVVEMVDEAEAISGYFSDIQELDKVTEDMLHVADTYKFNVTKHFVLHPTGEDLIDGYLVLASFAFNQGHVNISRDLLRAAKELDQLNRKATNVHRHDTIDHRYKQNIYFNNFDKFVNKLKYEKLGKQIETPITEESRFKNLYIDIFINTTLTIIVDEQAVKEATIYRNINLSVEDEENYKKLCQGVEQRTAKELSQLFCRLDNQGSNWLKLMPAKIEMQSNDPEVIIFHDVVTNKQLDVMQQRQLGMLTFAKVLNVDAEEDQKAHRLSYLSWLDDMIGEEIKQTTFKIEQLTGFYTNKEAAEHLQVNVYRAGGRFLPHMDSHAYLENLGKNVNNDATFYETGDRIATFMIYLNDDYVGGRTVFTKLGISVAPIKGTALYWKSLLHSGMGDTLSNHGGCSVLAGIKWVANKWIKSSGQMFRHKCKKTPKKMGFSSKKSYF